MAWTTGPRALAGVLPAFVLPALWWALAGDHPFGPDSVDRAGHLWTTWHAAREPLLTTTLLRHPEGLDLLPVLGGWLDVVIGGALTPLLGLERAYNAVLALYLAVAALGGRALARAAGASAGASWVAGLLLQLDGFVLSHALGGRAEQTGLGFVALALAGAVAAWRQPGFKAPILAGLAGAAVLFVSWELSLLLVGMTLVLGLGLAWVDRPPGALARWGVAALVTAAVAGPWVALFLLRAGDVRASDEGAFSLKLAARASIGLLDWSGPGGHRPSWGALLALLALPWTTSTRDRRGWVAIGLGLLLVLLLALGPAPRLRQGVGTEDVSGWGSLFSWLQSMPLLGWYHWPDRLMAAWSLAAAAAAGLAVSRLPLRLGVGLAALLLGGALAETVASGRWPTGGPPLPRPEAVLALAARPEPGAVLDLPPAGRGFSQARYQLLQVAHERPIRFHIILPHLMADRGKGWDLEHPLLQWAQSLTRPRARPVPADLGVSALLQKGYRFVALHGETLRLERRLDAIKTLSDAFGPPILRQDEWRCWEIK